MRLYVILFLEFCSWPNMSSVRIEMAMTASTSNIPGKNGKCLAVIYVSQSVFGWRIVFFNATGRANNGFAFGKPEEILRNVLIEIETIKAVVLWVVLLHWRFNFIWINKHSLGIFIGMCVCAFFYIFSWRVSFFFLLLLFIRLFQNLFSFSMFPVPPLSICKN